MIASADGDSIKEMIESNPSVAQNVLISVSPNPWMDFYTEKPAGIIFQVVYILALLSVMSLIVSRLWAWYRFDKSFRLTIPKSILGLEFLANIWRFLFALDPWFLWNFYPVAARNVFLSFHFLFSISACLLLVTFWLSVSTSPASYKSALRKLRIPLIILVVLLFIFEISADVVRVLPTPTVASSIATVSSAAYIIVLLLVAGYFIVSGILLLRRIRESSKLVSQYSNRRVRKIVICLIAYSSCLFVTIIGLILLAIPAAFATVAGNYISIWLSWGGLVGSSLFLTISIRRPRSDSSGSLSSDTPQSKKTSHLSKPNINQTGRLSERSNANYNNSSGAFQNSSVEMGEKQTENEMNDNGAKRVASTSSQDDSRPSFASTDNNNQQQQQEVMISTFPAQMSDNDEEEKKNDE